MKRVLLIEDLPQVAEHLKGMLAREKEVEVAGVQAQAEAGIAQATTEKPDVVVADALLQGRVNGFDVEYAEREPDETTAGCRYYATPEGWKPLPSRGMIVRAINVAREREKRGQAPTSNPSPNAGRGG